MRIKEVCEDVKGEPKQRLVFTSSFFFFLDGRTVLARRMVIGRERPTPAYRADQNRAVPLVPAKVVGPLYNS